jgi:hypothetical protein
MLLHQLLFGVPLILGTLLVVCSVLGASEWGELDGDSAETSDVGAGEPGDGGLLGMLGIGRIPLMLVATLQLLLFGGAGFAVIDPSRAALGPDLGLAVAVAIAALVALVGTAGSAWLLDFIWPRTETYAPSADELIGLCGTVLVRLGTDQVVVRVRDPGGAELQLHCHVSGDVSAGDSVELTARERQRGHYVARRVRADDVRLARGTAAQAAVEKEQ